MFIRLLHSFYKKNRLLHLSTSLYSLDSNLSPWKQALGLLDCSRERIWCTRAIGATGAPVPVAHSKMLENIREFFLVHQHNINACYHKNSTQNSEQCSRYKNDKFDVNMLRGQNWIPTCVMYCLVSNLSFLYLKQCFQFWFEFLWQRTLMFSACTNFFLKFFEHFLVCNGRPVHR